MVDELSKTRWTVFPLLAILCWGGALRLYGADALPIWIDEAYSYWSAQQSWAALWTEIPRYETHPPAFYSLVKLWLGLGESERILRLLPTLLGMAAIPLTYVAGRTIGGRGCGLLAAMLIACTPWQIIQAQNLRPYTLVTLATALVVAGALHIVNNPRLAAQPIWRPARTTAPMLGAYAALSVGNALLLWSHNLNILLCASLGLFLLIWWKREGGNRTLLANLLLSVLGAVLLYLPNIAIIIMQFSVVRRGWWLSVPSVETMVWQSIELFGFPLFGARLSTNLLVNAVLLLPFVAGAVVALRMSGEDSRPGRSMTLLAVCAFGPWLGAILITFLAVPVFLDRTLTMVQVPACLLLATAAVAVGRLSTRRRRIGTFIVFVIPLICSIGFHLRDQRADEVDRGWKAIVAAIAVNARGEPPIFAIPNASAIPLAYYARRSDRPLKLVPLPAPYPAAGYADYPSGNQAEPAIDARARAAVVAALRGQAEAWYVSRGAVLFDPDNSVERLLGAHYACRTFHFGSAQQAWMVAIRFHGTTAGNCGGPSITNSALSTR